MKSIEIFESHELVWDLTRFTAFDKKGAEIPIYDDSLDNPELRENEYCLKYSPGLFTHRFPVYKED